ncbi:hypothetical protein ABPG77_004372 [Micractinium sp. CCAP 211/92]
MSEAPVGQTGEGLRLVLVAGLLLLSVGLVFRSRHISSARHLEQAGVQQASSTPPPAPTCFDINSSSWRELRPPPGSRPTGRQAVAVFLGSWGHGPGVRALYNSFLYHSPPPNTDFVVMCSEGLAEEHRQLMRSWGVTVIPVVRVPNPPWGTWTHPACKGQPSCMSFSKFRAWQLTQYEKVLVLDTDMIFVRPPGDLLAWCADDGPVVTLDMGPADFPPAGMPNAGSFLLTPSNQTFAWLMKQMAIDRGELTQMAQYLIDQTILGFSFGGNGGWYVAGMAATLCTGQSKAPEAAACNGFASRIPLEAWRFRPPMQTLKRGLEGKGKAEAAAILQELGTFLLHFVTTKPWSGNKWEDQVYRGANELWWEMHDLEAQAGQLLQRATENSTESSAKHAQIGNT